MASQALEAALGALSAELRANTADDQRTRDLYKGLLDTQRQDGLNRERDCRRFTWALILVICALAGVNAANLVGLF